jgi:hypothetical protein
VNPQLLFVIGLLVACIGLFVANKPRMDVVALLVMVILPLSGILKVSEAIARFSDSNVILIAAMFVIGEGLVRTGIAFRLGRQTPIRERRRNLLDLIRDYQLAGRERRFRIRPDSPLVGKMLQDLGPRRRHGANIVAIERETRFRREFISAGAHTELRASDILLVDVPGLDTLDARQADLPSKFGLWPSLNIGPWCHFDRSAQYITHGRGRSPSCPPRRAFSLIFVY